MYINYTDKNLIICMKCYRVQNPRNHTHETRYHNDCQCLPEPVINEIPRSKDLEKWEWAS